MNVIATIAINAEITEDSSRLTFEEKWIVQMTEILGEVHCPFRIVVVRA